MKSMDQITIPETTITPEQYTVNARQLIASVLLQGVRDYCKADDEPKRKAILKELRSSHMDFVSNGMSIITAEQLEKNCEAIKTRITNEEDL
jgi:hypothetical protein